MQRRPDIGGLVSPATYLYVPTLRLPSYLPPPYLPTYLSNYLPTYLATFFLPTYMYLSTYFPTYLPTYLTTSFLPTYLPTYLQTYLPPYPGDFLLIYPPSYLPTNIVATYLPNYPLRNKIITDWCLFRYRSLCKYVPGKTIRPTTVSRGTATNSGTHQNVAERRLLHRQLIVFIKVVLFFVIRSEGQRLSIKISFISVADPDLRGGEGGHPDPEIRGAPSP